MVELRQICHSYTGKSATQSVLNGVDLTVEEGEFLAIMGPSGSGKSTLLHIMGGILRPTSGVYQFQGKDVFAIPTKQMGVFRNRSFGYIMQNFALVSDYTVFQNVEIPLLYGTAMRAADRKRKILEALERVGLQHKQKAYVSTLSGGEKQRTALARALVNAPKLLLADEPTGSLDQKNGQMVMDLLLGLQKEGRTIVMVTHNPQLAEQCSRTVFVKDGVLNSNGPS